MLGKLISTVLSILVLLVIGSLILDLFPAVRPIYEEIKMHAVNLYNMSVIKYGTIPTVVIIIVWVYLFGGTKRY